MVIKKSFMKSYATVVVLLIAAGVVAYWNAEGTSDPDIVHIGTISVADSDQLTIESSEPKSPQTAANRPLDIEKSNAIVISRLEDPAQLPGMESWLQNEFLPSRQGREISNVSVISIDPSVFGNLLPGQQFDLVLGPTKSLRLETANWRPFKHGGGSWVGVFPSGLGKVTLHVDYLGNVDGAIRLPGEAWSIKVGAYQPFHVAYQIVDTIYEVG